MSVKYLVWDLKTEIGLVQTFISLTTFATVFCRQVFPIEALFFKKK